MTIDPGFSLVISFMGFVWFFVKKVYPLVAKMLDEHIGAVSKRISQAEEEKENAALMRQEACEKEKGIAIVIENNKKTSREKLEKLLKENEEYLKVLFKRFEVSLKAQLEAEMVKQKDMLLEKMSDEIIKKITQQIKTAKCDVLMDLKKEDLQKLV
ncbi:MAG: hypothetical protein LBB25_01975 [Holosporaceae bacterium]|jgi:F-type H+-transporting ATPase subunit b|nr:hypothetical protein [Holosporaceae bacterium]